MAGGERANFFRAISRVDGRGCGIWGGGGLTGIWAEALSRSSLLEFVGIGADNASHIQFPIGPIMFEFAQPAVQIRILIRLVSRGTAYIGQFLLCGTMFQKR